MYYPYRITVNSSSGYVYVVDSWNKHIQKFDRDGDFIAKWGNEGTRNGQFNHPTGITIDSFTSYVYVADLDNDRIQVFAPDK
jgi:tripartite motif-containing protein 71